MQGIGIFGFVNRGFQRKVEPTFDKSLADVNCIQCRQCVSVCPVGALHEKEEIDDVITALNNHDKYVIVQTAPAIRAELGEEFGFPFGTNVTPKMVAALRRLGFNCVYDTNHGADLTIMEEGLEFQFIRGVTGLKEATLDLQGTIIKVAFAHSMALVKPLPDDIRNITSIYDFIEKQEALSILFLSLTGTNSLYCGGG